MFSAATAPTAGAPDFLAVFNALPGANLLLAPDLRIVAASDDYLAATLTQRAALVGQFIFDAFPDNPGAPEAHAVGNVRAALAQVLATRLPHELAPQHYDVPDPAQPGRFVERHWLPRHTPVLDAQGQVQFIIQSVQDITASRLAARQLRESQAGEQAARAEARQQRAELRQVLEQAPVAVAMYQGPEFRVEMANATTLATWDRPLAAVLGRPLFEVLPEAATPEVVALFERVFATGIPHTVHEQPTFIRRHGRREVVYWNFVFLPQPGADGASRGLLTVGTDVTAQVLARRQAAQFNQALEVRVRDRTAQVSQQQGLLQQILGQVPAAIGTLSGPEHRYTFFNDRYRAMSTGRLALGRPVAEAHPEVVAQGVIGLLDNVYATGRAFIAAEMSVQLHNATTDQLEQRYLDYIYQPMPDAQGQLTGILVFVLDVTERVLAREHTAALQADLLAAAQRQVQEREAFHNVFEQAPALIALLRAPGHRFEYVNPAYQALFAGRQLVGLNVAVAVPELQAQGFVAAMDRVYQTGESFVGEEIPFAPTPRAGQPRALRYYTFTYQAYREAGQIAGITVFAFDVTEQVLARQEREAQRQQLHDLFRQAPAAICILDGPDLVYELVNPGYQALFAGRALHGRALLDALPEIAGHTVHRTFRQVYDTGLTHEEQDILIPLARADGELEDRYFHYIQQARRDASGRVDGVLVFAFEVTEQVRARQQVDDLNQQLATINEELRSTNEELHDANAQLTRTNVDLDNFIYTASHDLKVPIANIEGLLQELARQLPPAALVGDVPEMLQLMQLATERFRRTIEQLTDVTRLQQAHAQPPTQVGLATLVEEVRLDLLPLAAQTQAQLTVDVPAGARLPFSEKNLRSVVYNLLSNAFKYHHPDRPPQVQLTYCRQDRHHVLRVQDNGLGIDLARAEGKLFGMFQRLHTHVEGSGIGLYMVKKIVEISGGRIEVASQLGEGTTFTVFFPVHPSS